MKTILMPCLALLALPALADEQRVYRVDAYGNVTYSEGSLSVSRDGRIVEVDTYGSEQPHKTQYVLRNSRVYEADSYGRIQYGKPSYAVGKDGRVVQTDAYGSKRYTSRSTRSKTARSTRPTRTATSASRSSRSRRRTSIRRRLPQRGTDKRQMCDRQTRP